MERGPVGSVTCRAALTVLLPMFFLSPDDTQRSHVLCGECLGWGVAMRCWYVLTTDTYNCLLHGVCVDRVDTTPHLQDRSPLA